MKRSVVNYLGSLKQFYGTNLVNLLMGQRERERGREIDRERERGNNVRGNLVDSRDDMTKTDISADEHEGDTVCCRVSPKAKIHYANSIHVHVLPDYNLKRGCIFEIRNRKLYVSF